MDSPSLELDALYEAAEPVQNPSDAASIAVCVCTYDRPEGLAACLEAIAGADLTDLNLARFFVVVVDNKPDGRVRRLCRAWSAERRPRVVCVDEETRGISFARNRALREAFARGAGFVAFVDDDDVPRPDWLRELVLAQRRSGAELVFGRWQPQPGIVIPDWLAGVRFLRPPRWDRLDQHGLPAGTGTFNVLIARTLVQRLAPDGVLFLPDLARCGGSDRELFVRAARMGAVHALAPESFVIRGWEEERLTLRGVLKRGFRLGHSKAVIDRRHGAPGEAQQWFRHNLRKLPGLALGVPKRLRSRRKLTQHLYRIAKVAGEINGHLGGKLTYYG